MVSLTLAFIAFVPGRALSSGLPSDKVSLMGLSLTDALRVLQEQGLKIVFNSNVVRQEMHVEVEPKTTAPRDLLDELLAPHGLLAREAPGGGLVIVPENLLEAAVEIRGVVRDRSNGAPIAGARIRVSSTDWETQTDEHGRFRMIATRPGLYSLEAEQQGFLPGLLENLQIRNQVADVDFELDPLPREFEEIVVTPSRFTLSRNATPPPLSINHQEVGALPRISGDLLRGLTLVPGIAGSEASAQLSIRGGHADENLVLLDGIELVEPYHLNDFGSALSIVAPEVVERIDVTTGGAPVEFGDRSSGVINLVTASASRDRTVLAAGVLESHVLKSGSFSGGRANWLGIARVGTFDEALRVDGRREKPDYWDVFGKVGYEFGEGKSMTGQVLFSDDHLDLSEQGPTVAKDYKTRYQSDYLWASLAASVGSRVFVESIASYGRVTGERDASEISERREFELSDVRDFFRIGLKQDWIAQIPEGQTLKWGGEVRHYDTRLQHRSAIATTEFLAPIRADQSSGEGSFEDTFREEQWSLYVSELFRPRESLSIEAGLRVDGYTLTDRMDLSPRLGLSYWLSPRSNFRLAVGTFVQSQRPYELQIIDGEREFALAERSNQQILSFERLLTSRLSLRAEAYHRVVENPRPRYENLFGPTSAFPEIQSDRFRLAPERSESEGIEVMLRRPGPRLNWWVHYARSRVRDRFAGREAPRRTDQPHALTLSSSKDIGRSWSLGLVWQLHTGWPTTPVFGRPDEPGGAATRLVPELGPLFSERLPDYHRLDARIIRSWVLPRGKLQVFLNLQNLYDRKNVRGYEFDTFVGDDGQLEIRRDPVYWRGFFPSFGFRWEF